MSQNYLILAINPGSTSTKIGLFKGESEIFTKSISHDSKILSNFDKITDQYEFRKDIILRALQEAKIQITSLNAVVGRGGLIDPIPSGTYSVSEKMLEDLKTGKNGDHASNLGGILAHAIATQANCKSFIVDPVVVDELDDIARLSGNPHITRKSIFHALNHKAVARLVAKKLGKNYSDLNLIIAHLGGGISVGIHSKGKVIDVNNALDGDGPFSPERSGGVPTGQIVNLCFSGKYSEAEIKKQIKGHGGLVAYLGTNNASEVSKRFMNGDSTAKLVYSAMAYQISKEIGMLSTVVNGKVDAIALTGGLARDKIFTDMIKERISFIANTLIFPGEEEMIALVQGALRVLNNEEKPKVY